MKTNFRMNADIITSYSKAGMTYH